MISKKFAIGAVLIIILAIALSFLYGIYGFEEDGHHHPEKTRHEERTINPTE